MQGSRKRSRRGCLFRSVVRASWPAWLAGFLVACGGQDVQRPPPRLVVLFATCTLNADYLSPYDAGVRSTPHLEEFAREAVVFERHQTEAGESGVAFASIFTGSQADRHGVYRQPTELPDEVLTVTEAFAGQGYETFFWGAHPAAAHALNYAQGVEPTNAFERVPKADDPRFVRILDRLERDEGYRAMLATAFTVTHAPYALAGLRGYLDRYGTGDSGLEPAQILHYARLHRRHHHMLSWNFPSAVEKLGLSSGEVDEFIRAVEILYRSNVHRLDRLFGEVVDAIDRRGLRDRSLIVFSADHGERLYREGGPFQWSHSMELSPEVLRVPLLVRLPYDGGPRRYASPTRSIDVFPTLAGLAGLDLDAEHGPQGVDLAPALRGETGPPDLPAFSHTALLNGTVFRQMYDPRWAERWARVRRLFPDQDPKWIQVALREGDRLHRLRGFDERTWEVEVFDLARDPGATRNLYDPGDAEHRRAAERLRGYKAKLTASYQRSQEAARKPSPEREEELLRDLGYVE